MPPTAAAEHSIIRSRREANANRSSEAAFHFFLKGVRTTSARTGSFLSCSKGRSNVIASAPVVDGRTDGGHDRTHPDIYRARGAGRIALSWTRPTFTQREDNFDLCEIFTRRLNNAVIILCLFLIQRCSQRGGGKLHRVKAR